MTCPLPVPAVCEALGLPEPCGEHRFHPARKWRFDWAWPDRLVAMEIDGGVWIGGRHNHPAGFIRDMEKLNAAAELGWRVLRYQPNRIDWDQVSRVLGISIAAAGNAARRPAPGAPSRDND